MSKKENFLFKFNLIIILSVTGSWRWYMTRAVGLNCEGSCDNSHVVLCKLCNIISDMYNLFDHDCLVLF